MVDGTYCAAIVGTGAIATAHARALRAHGDRIRLAAVVDIDARRAGAFAETWQADTIAPNVNALLRNDEIDLVHLCTPPHWHAPLALECLRAGVHVLVE